MPKTYRYKKTFYSEEDIANALGVDVHDMVIHRAGLLKDHWEIVVTEREESSTDEQDTRKKPNDRA